MIPPPEQLQAISKETIKRNDIDLILPIITHNYKTYFITREKLIGLQQTIRTYNKEISNENRIKQ
ncbi:hypothetical protein AFI02nite_12560 [Aliivibrio fischeri]|uniref:Uncharacterized protein n=1 Tax=Aliivibrio fischeri TaxID=668 RepID=A0A510UIP4_ALIFS|nr:hypothetical protein AFI02nite_12560 [Aliivibrio fischeri]